MKDKRFHYNQYKEKQGKFGVSFGRQGENLTTQIQQVFAGSPAEEAGIEAGDRVIGINNVLVNEHAEQTRYLISNSPYEQIRVEVYRDGKYNVFLVTPVTIIRYILGIEFQEAENRNIYYGFWETVNFSREIAEGIVSLFTGGVAAENLMGPVGIGHVITRTQGIMEFVSMMALISLAVGVTNLLPFPPLDGGKIVIYIVEAVRGKPMKEELEMRIQIIGFMLLIGLAIFATYNDVLRIF